MRICGLDPSIAAAGLAAIDRPNAGPPVLLSLETIRTASDLPDVDRYHTIFTRVGLVIRTHHVQLLAIEEQRGVNVGLYQREDPGYNADNSKTLIAVGAAMGAAFAYGASVIFVQPQSVKVALLGPGSRSASKEQVQQVLLGIIARAGIKRFSKDATDALAIAITGERKQRLAILKEGARR